MIPGLSQNETAAFQYLQHAPNGGYKLGAQAVETRDSFRNLLTELLQAWQDNPREMLKVLGFNLPSVLKMKFYSIQDVNQILSDNRHVYRVLSETTATSKDAHWTAQAGYLHIGQLIATVYIDSVLNRYLRLSNAQLFECSNADLLGMPEIDRVNIRAYLLGIID
jgi:hypothetical protein